MQACYPGDCELMALIAGSGRGADRDLRDRSVGRPPPARHRPTLREAVPMQNAKWTCFQTGWTGRQHDYMYRHIDRPRQASAVEGNAMAERFDRIWHNARLASLRADLPDLGIIEHGVIAACDGRIAFAGSRSDFPSDADATERIDCAGRWITPGLVDCHTHLVFGGNRAHEFELRLQGASYEEIARAGGGIVSTVAATRAASEAELVASALPRLDALIGEGVTTLEIKSGYGLNTETEMRQLSAARALGREPAGPHPDVVSRRACTASGSRWRQGPIHRSCLPRDVAVGGAGRARRRGRCLHGRHRVLAESKRRGCSARQRRLDYRSNCMPINCRTSAEQHWLRNFRLCPPIIWNTPMRLAS